MATKVETIKLDIGEFPPKMQEFISHWTAVNVALGASPLVLKGGYPLATFTTDRTAIVTAIDAIVPLENTFQSVSADLDIKKTAIKTRLLQFRNLVNGLFMGTIYPKQLATLPGFSVAESKFLKPFVDMQNVWAVINADVTMAGFTPPLLLAGGYLKATFDTDLTAVRTAYIAVENARLAASRARDVRDALLLPAYDRMKQYRVIAVGRLPEGSPLLATIPAITPAPGSTPDPVSANGQWNPATLKADYSWSKSTLDPAKFAKYQLRYSSGASYKAANAVTLADVPGINTLSLSSAVGLNVAGNKIAVKVFVLTTEGRESGSNTVVVLRT